ncbi:Blue copper protein 1b [Linum grandiflorum]
MPFIQNHITAKQDHQPILLQSPKPKKKKVAMAVFASNKRMVVLMAAVVVAAAAALVPTTSAVKYVVGDDAGWINKGVDYKAWAAGKMFYVGDTLVFNYAAGNHNVMKVNASDFQACTKPLAGPPPLTSGKDEVTLLTTGKKWYICGATGHCDAGQKLVITVSEGAAPAPTPNSPPNAAVGGVVGIGFVAAMIVGVIGMLLF